MYTYHIYRKDQTYAGKTSFIEEYINYDVKKRFPERRNIQFEIRKETKEKYRVSFACFGFTIPDLIYYVEKD